MNYPLISEYIQAIKLSEENFDKLTNLRPVLDVHGNPIMSSGNFAVVFKMQDKQTGKLYAVKCFLREQEGREESYKLIASELEYVPSGFLVSVKYLEKELFVDTTQGYDTEFPVLIMDWIEGITLDKYIRNNIHNRYNLSLVTYQFCRMASWLLSQEFAHGDLKPDNIIVREDGQLVLVDYDGMFVPAMKGQKARELGSVDYRHPLRAEDKFDSTIDDFSIASIALSLKAISLKPELLNDFGAEDKLLLSAKDYLNIEESECLKVIQSLANDVELAQMLGLFYIAYARNELDNVSFKLFNIAKPKYVPVTVPGVELSTVVTEEDLDNAVEDEYGVKYSRDGIRLLKAPNNLECYRIREGTIVICDNSFNKTLYEENLLCEITIPNTVKCIGNSAFSMCNKLKNIVIPESVVSIGKTAFISCSALSKLIIPHSIMNIGEGAFNNCYLLELEVKSIKFRLIENSILIDCDDLRIISCLNNINNVVIPNYIKEIGSRSFMKCDSLSTIIIPNSVTKIGFAAFGGCRFLNKIVIPNSVLNIEECAFMNCHSLDIIEVPDSVTRINNSTFMNCFNLRTVSIPKSVTIIGEHAFDGCSHLNKIIIPDSVVSIESYAFYGCNSLVDVFIPNSVMTIGDYAFAFCKSLQSVIIPVSLNRINVNIFEGCFWLKRVNDINGNIPKFERKSVDIELEF